MKKKVSIFLLSLLILPLSLLFGCDETVSYSFEAYTSTSTYGSVSGTGTYSEGSTVTLTAIARNGSSFIGWVKNSTTLLDGSGSYAIKNTTNSTSGLVSKSVLSFSSNSSTQGSYTAVFSESKVMYAKLSSIYFTTDLETTPTATASDGIFSVNSMIISQGTVDLSSIVSVENVSASDGLFLATSEISQNNSVVKLSTSTTQYVRANLVLVSNSGSSSIYTMRAGLNFQTGTTQNQDGSYVEIEGSKHSYHVEYANGEYKIVFTFSLSEETYYMVITYSTLS